MPGKRRMLFYGTYFGALFALWMIIASYVILVYSFDVWIMLALPFVFSIVRTLQLSLVAKKPISRFFQMFSDRMNSLAICSAFVVGFIDVFCTMLVLLSVALVCRYVYVSESMYSIGMLVACFILVGIFPLLMTIYFSYIFAKEYARRRSATFTISINELNLLGF